MEVYIVVDAAEYVRVILMRLSNYLWNSYLRSSRDPSVWTSLRHLIFRRYVG